MAEPIWLAARQPNALSLNTLTVSPFHTERISSRAGSRSNGAARPVATS